jgi:hypothetical protein
MAYKRTNSWSPPLGADKMCEGMAMARSDTYKEAAKEERSGQQEALDLSG